MNNGMRGFIRYCNFFAIFFLIFLSYMAWIKWLGTISVVFAGLLTILPSLVGSIVHYKKDGIALYYRTLCLTNIICALFAGGLHIFWQAILILIIIYELIRDIRNSFERSNLIWPFLFAFLTMDLSDYDRNYFKIFLAENVLPCLLIYLMFLLIKERKNL